MIRYRILIAFLALPFPSIADNCSGYGDCFNTLQLAMATAVALGILSFLLNFIPFIGTGKALIEAYTGTDIITGRKLENWERAFGIVPGLAVLGEMGYLAKVVNVVTGVGKIKIAKTAVKTVNSGAALSTNGVRLRQHLVQLEKYGAGGFKELANGRFRYYGQATLNRGNSNSFRMVREWNPATGGKRTWFETLTPTGGVIQVRPEFGTGVKIHYLFNGTGGYLGR